ncbi:PH domain-containing protein [Candidatus Microgenomates bacterium]|nr:MAG: PH domain-containing protein [Candidatus Microgenomates bacterium]
MSDVYDSSHHSNKKSVSKSTPKVTRDKEIPMELKGTLQGHTKNPLAAFCYYPDRVNFVAADSEERIVLLLRRHPITNLRWIIAALLMSVSPLVVSIFIDISTVPIAFQIIGIMFWYLITTAYIFEQFLSWFFNVYIVTDERVFDVDFVNLVYREITDAALDQIQDVTVRVGSVIRTLFDYGDISIQTAAEMPELEFEAVPHPDKVAQILRELRVEEEQEKLEGRVR